MLNITLYAHNHTCPPLCVDSCYDNQRTGIERPSPRTEHREVLAAYWRCLLTQLETREKQKPTGYFDSYCRENPP